MRKLRLKKSGDEGVVKRVLYYKRVMSDSYNHSPYEVLVEGVDADVANLIGSKTVDGYHAPVLDLDHECMLIPSKTEGHYHLYIDKKMSWDQYEKLLDVLYEVGLIQRGWYENSKKNKVSVVRIPSIAIREMFGLDLDE